MTFWDNQRVLVTGGGSAADGLMGMLTKLLPGVPLRGGTMGAGSAGGGRVVGKRRGGGRTAPEMPRVAEVLPDQR